MVHEDGKDPAPTRKGLSIPHLWGQFRQALADVEEGLIQAGWLDREDLTDEVARWRATTKQEGAAEMP